MSCASNSTARRTSVVAYVAGDTLTGDNIDIESSSASCFSSSSSMHDVAASYY